MAVAYIQEYEKLAVDGSGFTIQAGKEPALASQAVIFTTSVASAAFQERTRFIRVSCNANANLAFGLAPTATATSMEVQADTPEFFGVIQGQKVAIYDGSS
jgi:hypothetical protein